LTRSLPDNITSGSSLTVFRQKLRTFISAVISGHYYVACLWLVLAR